jgi:hypothetical protein
MESAIFKSNSKSDFRLLLEIAKKLNIQTQHLSDKDIESIAIVNAIELGETNENVDISQFMATLAKNN